jgi:hypothetical protein
MTTVRVQCSTCFRDVWVDFGIALRRGWPKCHGTMTLIDSPSAKEIGEAVQQIVGPVQRIVRL